MSFLKDLFSKKKDKPCADTIEETASQKKRFAQAIVTARTSSGTVPVEELTALLEYMRDMYVRDAGMMSKCTDRNTYHYGDLAGCCVTYAEMRGKIIALIRKNGGTYGTRSVKTRKKFRKKALK